MLKKAAATVNERYGRLDSKLANAMRQACDEVIAGKLDDHFPLVRTTTGCGLAGNHTVLSLWSGLCAGRLPNRLWHSVQHERERGHFQPRH